jgi:osmotically-inducible protein OsmY
MRNNKIYLITISSIFYAGSVHSVNNLKNEPNGILELPTEVQEAEIRKLDTELAQRIYERLSDEWSSNSFRYLQVKVNNGVVSLTGLVQTVNDKKKLEDKIKNMIGVRRLDSEIKVLENPENPMNKH